MAIELYDYQEDAIKRMKNGCILCGGVGSGKSRTALAYYYTLFGGDLKKPKALKGAPPLYIITTARKRDTKEWEKELDIFNLTAEMIDSWNKVASYKDVENAFFIFDEQRVVGYGTWAKSFIKIAKHNKWILLSATPGDTWSDYIPVFIANGWYRNKTEFLNKHAVWARFAKFPKIERYVGLGILNAHRRDILITMDFHREAVQHHEDVLCDYDELLYKQILRRRWNIFKDEPVRDASGLCYCLRRLVNEDEDRGDKVIDILKTHPKAIIFYNFDYELEVLQNLRYEKGTKVAEWNGHKHEPIPIADRWVYLVQYTAGAEGWNCIETDTVIFYSQNYSYRIMTQSSGRIDRLNTPFTDLYYYHLRSNSTIDSAILRALKMKKNFQEKSFTG
jgi:hypothetical protein